MGRWPIIYVAFSSASLSAKIHLVNRVLIAIAGSILLRHLCLSNDSKYFKWCHPALVMTCETDITVSKRREEIESVREKPLTFSHPHFMMRWSVSYHACYLSINDNVLIHSHWRGRLIARIQAAEKYFDSISYLATWLRPFNTNTAYFILFHFLLLFIFLFSVLPAKSVQLSFSSVASTFLLEPST